MSHGRRRNRSCTRGGQTCAAKTRRAAARADGNAERRCTAERPCPAPGAVGMSWFHPFVVVHEGSLFDEVECPHCLFRLKTAKPR